MNLSVIFIMLIIVILIITIRALVMWARPKQPPKATQEKDEKEKEDPRQSGIQKFFSWIWVAIIGILWAIVPLALIVIAFKGCSEFSKPIVQKSLNPYAKTWTMVITAIDSSQRRLLLATKVIVTKPSVSMLSWHYSGENHLVIFNEELKYIGKWDDGNQHGFFQVDGYNAALTPLSDWESEIKGDFWDDGDDPNQPAPYRFVLRPNPW